MYKLGIIYYISKSNIELIYKNNFGPNKETTYKNESEQRKGLSLKLGLEKFLKILTGANFSAEGTIEKSDTMAEEIRFKESVEDRALVLINELFTDDLIPDIKEITKHETPFPIYSFSLLLEITESFNQKGSGTLIEVSHHSDNLNFKGVTSSENWNSNSLVNNVLYTGSFEASGIFMPLKVMKENNMTNLTVQYLVIYNKGSVGE